MEEKNQQTVSNINDLQQELDLLRAQKSELEDQIKRKNNEASETQIQVEKLNHEVTTKISDYQRNLKEKEDNFNELHMNYKQLEDQFQVSSDKLQFAEKKIKEMEEERQKTEAHMNGLQLELDSLRNQKGTLEDQIGRKDTEASEALIQMEKLNHELTSKISDLEKMLEDKEHNFNELHTNYTLLNFQFQETREKLQVAEAKIEEMVDENQNIVESKDERIRKMQMVSEVNEKEVETAGGEIGRLRVEVSKLDENCKELREKIHLLESEKTEMSKEKGELLQSKDEKIGMLHKTEARQKEEIARLEVLLRLSNRKLQITETEFTEKEENYLKMRQKLHEEYKLLEAHSLRSSETTGLLEKERIEIKEVTKSSMEILNSGLYELELMVHKLDEKHNNFLTRMSNWSQELQVMKHWAAAIINEKAELRDKVRVLETKFVETEAKIMDREEEKREAIRQLCLWIEYHRENHNHLQKLLVVTRKRNR
ncbi:hypothetical protein MRB53_001772 [Persea americana]|uniref:Uncharacterized protein n=1 Tax=Persea americana TaxID=3435 RepID=A0ACC2MUC4_PERAE|nr:hypothetical protein MRB53_001772 [Persea americana]